VYLLPIGTLHGLPREPSVQGGNRVSREVREGELPTSITELRALLRAVGDHSHAPAPYGEPVHSFIRSGRDRLTAEGGVQPSEVGPAKTRVSESI